MKLSFRNINMHVNDELDSQIAKLKFEVNREHKDLQEYLRKLKVKNYIKYFSYYCYHSLLFLIIKLIFLLA